MIGIYNYTVIITYLSLVFAVAGMYLSATGSFRLALGCMLLSGLCDMLDGPVARTKKRTETEKKFGIQIDSLCDLVSFGVQPAAFVFCLSLYASQNEVIHLVSFVIGVIFAICAVIRLAYFNVTEEERQEKEGNKSRTGYQGLPVTNAAWIVPMFFLTRFFLSGELLAIVMIAVIALIAFLFVFNFNMVKLHGKKLFFVGLFGAALLTGIVFLPAGI